MDHGYLFAAQALDLWCLNGPLREQARSHIDLCRSCRVKRGCDLLILFFKIKIKRSQRAAAPTEVLRVYGQ